MQYTVRNVPKRLDAALRRRARQQRKSLNQVTIEALTEGAGLAAQPVRHHDLDWIAGTWVEDPEFNEILQAQRQIDPEMWK